MSCVAFAYYDRTSFAAARQQTLGVLVESVAQSAFGPAAFQDPDSAQVILKVLEAEPMAMAGAIYLKDEVRLTEWKRADAGVELPAKGGEFSIAPTSWLIRREIKNAEQTVGYLAVVFDTKDVAARTRKFIQIAGGVLGLAALAAFLIAAVAQRVFTRPVQLLSQAAHRVQAERDFETRAVKVSNDELGELTDAFNSMLAMIQARDKELESHRVHLEDLVSERTQELNTPDEFESLEQAVSSGASHATIQAALQRLLAEPVEPKLERLASRAVNLAERLDKGKLSVVVNAKGVRHPAGLQWLWQVMPHLIANAVDHGVRREEVAGKPPILTLTAKELPGALTLEVGDNGAGIDWERVRSKAEAAGLPHKTHHELVAALFADGISTRDEASEVSGRGVGLAAVKAACVEHGAEIGIDSKPNFGTRFLFRVPVAPPTHVHVAPNLATGGQRWSVPVASRASIRPRVSLTPASS